jgi:hypothetical protein
LGECEVSIFGSLKPKKQMKKKLMLSGMCSILLLGTVDSTFAQNRKLKNDSSTVIIFTQKSSSTSTERKVTGEDNIIKITPLGLLTGVFPIAYERRITDFLGLQIAGGITHKNYIRGAFQKSAFNDDGDKVKFVYPDNVNRDNDMADPLFTYDNRQAKLGYTYSIQPRFYYESEALDGGYVSFSYDFYRYNFEIPGLTVKSGSYEHLGAMQQEHENVTDFMVNFGSQAVYDRLTLEYSTGLGIRNVKGSKYVAEVSGSTLREGMATYKQTLLNFTIGFKIGYHF